MTAKINNILDQTYLKFLDLMLYSDYPLNMLDELVSEDIMGYGTTLDEKILDIDGLKNLSKMQREQSVGMNMEYELTPVFRKTMNNGSSAVIVDEIKIIMKVENEKMELDVRMSTIWEFTDGIWKLTHWHGSKPEYDSGGNDTWHKEEWTQKQAILERQVQEKTEELQKQNRELEIEAALERVRASSMAMKNSSEINTIIFDFYKELTKLDAYLDRCLIMIVNHENLGITWWLAGKEGLLSENGFFVQNNNYPSHQLYIDHWKKRTKKWQYLFEGTEKEEWDQFGFSQTELSRLPAVIKNDMSEVKKIYLSGSSESFGCIVTGSIEPLADIHKDIIYRFARVFNQTYTRFLDLQKVEEQARESEIQLALERVRARTMAMQKSEELAEAATLLFEQVKKLGIETYSSGFNIINEENKKIISWMSNPGGILNPPFIMPLTEYNQHARFFEAWKNKVQFIEDDITGERLTEHYRYLRSFPLLDKAFSTSEKLGIKTPDRQVHNAVFFSFGYLLFITLKPTPQHHEIFKRFGKVFEQTYTRFLDLQNAEEQAREAKIEAALERVRSRSMAMYQSTELNEVAYVLFEQLRTLGGNLWGTGFALCNTDSSTDEFWFANENGILPPVKIPHIKDPVHIKLFDEWKNNSGFYAESKGSQELKAHYDYLLSLPEVRPFFQVILDAGFTFPEWQQWNAAFFRFGYLLIITIETYHEPQILQRFAKVFEQAYTRFLDLKKAEEQAREAEIQLALERVRARTMAMHKSEELSDTASIMFRELKKLGVNSIRTGVCIFDFQQDSAELWLATEDGDKTETKSLGKVSGDMHPMYRQWIDAGANKKKRFQYTLSGKEVGKYYKMATSHLNLPKQKVYNKNEIYNGFLFPEGSINIISLKPLNEEESDIGNRFANVFGLLYRRFLDLQKAEAQAREAQIEAALERVRSRSMAMQKSEELSEVIQVVFDQLIQFISNIDGAGFNVDIRNSDDWNLWDIGFDFRIPAKLHVPYFDHPLSNAILKARDNGTEQMELSLNFEEKNAFLDHFTKYVPLPQELIELLYIAPGFLISEVFFKDVFLYVYNYSGIAHTDVENAILLRFGKVFEQTYTRFLDLQKAEAQAREALKQASLDRVRGEIASMRNSEDLNRITPVIWRELLALEVPFFRCGVFIINEKEEKVHVYLSTPSGKALAALHLDLDANELTKNTVEHWRGKRIFKTYWNREEFNNWSKSMVQTGQVESVETYQGANVAPESLNLHFVPFRQGMLYVGDGNPLNNEKLDLVKTLAEAFSIAYARYEDFKHLEEAKNKIEITLAELKAAQSQLIQSEKMASLGELTAGIAHEIQNPLNFVNNFSEVSNELIDEMKEEMAVGNAQLANEIAEDIKQNLEKINHHGKRAEAIVKGMLLHSRGSSGQKEPTDINALCDEYLRLSYHGFRAKDKSFNADFKLEADNNLPKIKVVPQDIGRVLLNLINNAFYAVQAHHKAPLPPEGGFQEDRKEYRPIVIVRTSSIIPPSGGTRGAIISVYDNGPGIPDSIKDKIFQPFFTTKPTGQGTGLGLSLSYDIVKAHGGTMEVKSNTQGETGTEFIITIPIN